MGTLYCAQENGADLYVNEHQKIRQYRATSTEELEERRMPNRDFYFARCVRKLRYYSDVIHSFDWKSAMSTMVVFKMCDSVPSARYSSVCNVLHLYTLYIYLYYSTELFSEKCLEENMELV